MLVAQITGKADIWVLGIILEKENDMDSKHIFGDKRHYYNCLYLQLGFFPILQITQFIEKRHHITYPLNPTYDSTCGL